jgi:hypothetical protein
MTKKPEDFCEDCDLAQATIEEMESMIESYKQAIRTAFHWSKDKACWQQARDILKNQMHEMGEL